MYAYNMTYAIRIVHYMHTKLTPSAKTMNYISYLQSPYGTGFSQTIVKVSPMDRNLPAMGIRIT